MQRPSWAAGTGEIERRLTVARSVARERLERWRLTSFLLRASERFEEIEGRHLAIVVATNLFIAFIPLLIVGYALVERFNAHRDIGTVLASGFHLTGRTATIVDSTFPSAGSDHRVALSISLISLLVTAFDISKTVQLAYARAFRMAPMTGAARYLRGATWLLLLLALTAVGLTTRDLEATNAAWVSAVLFPGVLLVHVGFYLVTPRLVMDLPFAWRDLVPGALIAAVASLGLNLVTAFELHRWFGEYARAYGSYGIALAIMAAVAVNAAFWIWIAAFMGTYWEDRAGAVEVAELEDLAESRAGGAGAAPPGAS
jgi:uncharacterized BrkB/YihY/UPF0761 family membrane protein